MSDAPRELHAVLDNIRSAFNAGSIFRTSDAAALTRLHLCGMTPVPPNPKLARSALGADGFVPWTRHATSLDAIEALKADGVVTVAMENAPGSIDYTEFQWPDRVALVLGHEVRGIRPDALEACDAVVEIPMLGKKNTLNVATAYGIVLFEALRQWKQV